MTTRRTTMKAGYGAKPRAMAASRPRGAAHHAHAMELPLRSPEFEKGLRIAKRRAAELANVSKEQAAAAWKVMRRSLKEALAASKLATNKLAKRVAAATAPEKPAKAGKRHAAKAGHGLTA